jgi:hypothetical protein
MNTWLWWGRQNQGDDLENLGIYERNNIQELGWKGVDWFHLAQNRDEGGFCEHRNECTGSTNVDNFLIS